MRNPSSLDPILSSTSSSFSNSSLVKNQDVTNSTSAKSSNSIKIKKASHKNSKLLSRTAQSASNSSGSSQAPIIKPRSISSNESQSTPDDKDSSNSTTCWLNSKESSKSDSFRISSITTANFLETNFRKSFLRKQYLIKKNRLGKEINNFFDTRIKPPIENKAKASFVNFVDGANVNNNTYYKTNSLRYTQEERETATTTIILDLEKYNINDKSSKLNSGKNIMVNIPLTPKKYHTFNENDSPSHKESSNTLVINSQIPINQNGTNNKPSNGDVIFLNKPIAKNNSTVNQNNLKNKPIIRRPPKEFLSATNTQKEPGISVSRNGSIERNSIDDPYHNESHENRTTSPVTKSLPSYDEALKRVSSEAKSSKNRISSSNVNKSSPTPFTNNIQNSIQSNVNRPNNKTSDPNVATTFIQQSNNPTSGFNSFFKNRNALPNLPLQSTFKSLLSTPINTVNQPVNQNGQKVYFRPQDLQNRPSSTLQNNDLLSFQKNNQNEKVSNNLNTNGMLVTPVPAVPSRRISTKNLIANTSPTPNNNRDIDKTEIKNTSNQVSQPVASPVPIKSDNSLGFSSEKVNPVMQRTPSPKIENIFSQNSNPNKMRSWSNTPQNILETVERSKSPEKQQIINWKSTVNNDKPNSDNNKNTKNKNLIDYADLFSPKTKTQTDSAINQNFEKKLTNELSVQAPSSSNHNNKDEKEKIDETITGSFLETISDSSATPTLSNKHSKKENEKISGLNDARLLIKTSSNTTDSTSIFNSNHIKSSLKNSFKRNLNQKLMRQNSNSNDPTLERPPGRLNYYDSDTNTISEGVMITSNLIKRSNSEYLHKKTKNDEFSDAPDLSDITEGKFDELDIQGKGHRTSTPNLSKKRRSTSLSSSDIKQIKKQIEELEKMYFELLRIIDPEKHSLYSGNGVSSSTSLSSFNSSYTHTGSNLKNSNKIKHGKNDINQIKHRFSRMESHLTSLAKTVAQISLELKSIKSIEEVIYALTKEVQELKRVNLKKLNNEETDENQLFEKINDFHRSTSEPNLINSLLNSDNLKHSESTRKLSYSKYAKSTFSLIDKKFDDFNSNQKHSLSYDKEKFRLFAPSYSNPKKLKKLTKFFGQEPPMLRLFLQKLNYEMYAPNFEHEHITITELPYLSEERLKSLGIPLGPRLRIMKEAQLSFRFDNNNNINYNLV